MDSPDLSSDGQEVNSHDSLVQISGQTEVERINDNDTPFQDDDNILPIIGLGGSAGSIAALQEFFGRVRPDLGIAYVVVIHLSPDYNSALAQVLGDCTSMPVMQVEGTVEVQPNCVYVIPPSRHLSMRDGHIYVSEPQQEAGQRVAVDLFFRTLAVSHRSKAVAVVLSGMDGDGAIGVKRIKEAGGVTVAQEPTEAEHEGMPRTAIETGMVDWILPVRDIAAKVGEWIHNEERIHLPRANEITPSREDVDETALREILSFLQARTGHDFQHYKRATILRRIGRRLQVNSQESLPQYVNFLRTHPGEAGALLQDLLISVTNFFRDPEAFLGLELLLPRLFRNRDPSETVRIWVAGCATGEEAYSLAILLDEYVASLDAAPEVQIFATDLDDQALRFAREGVYPATIAADVSPERLRRYFVFDQGRYRVKKEVRERILFAQHNVLQDAPFSRIDLVSCRNLLIYFNHQAQERAFQVFHFALKTGGMMFLGGSESADDTSLFVVQDRVHRIYERQVIARTPLVLPSMVSPALLRPVDVVRPAYLPPPTTSNVRSNKPTLSYSELHLKLLEQAAPPSVLVDANYDIVHLSEHAGQFLRPVGGEVSMNLLAMVAPALRVELRVALFRAMQSGQEVDVPPISVDVGGRPRRLRLRVRPMQGDESPNDLSNFVLVVFEDTPTPDNVQAESSVAPSPPPSDQSEVVQSLEAELEHLRSYLRASIEQYETSTEELKASNEELQALNEEQRSAAEELETSREEIQAGNEELTTVNTELKAKIEELGRANSDLQNLMSSTDIATVFLSRNLHIKRYTPPAVELFHFIPTDTGRPIDDLKHDFNDERFIEDAALVLRTLVPQEREIRTQDGRWFLSRTSPYRTVEDKIDGVVLTFVDITYSKQAETTIRQSEEQFRALVTASSDAIYQMSPDWKEMRNLKGMDFLPDTDAPSGIWLERYIPEESRPQVLTAIRQAISTKSTFELEHPVIQADGAVGWTFSRAVPLLDEQGEITDWFGTASNITERKRAEEALREREAELARVQRIGGVGGVDIDVASGLTGYRSPEYRRLHGLLPETTHETHEEWLARVHPDDREQADSSLQEALAGTSERYESEYRIIRPNDGQERWISARLTIERDDSGQPVRLMGAHIDITQRKQAEEALRASEEKYRALFDSIDEGFCIIEVLFDERGEAVDHRFVEVNRAFEQQTGLQNVVNRLSSELAPSTESYWREAYGLVAQTGEPLRFENYHNATGRWYDAYASRLDSDGTPQVAIVFADITQRKQQEQRQAFLLKLSDTLRPLVDPLEIHAAVTATVLDHFGVDRCYYCEIEDNQAIIRRDAARGDLPSVVGIYPLEYFPLFKTMMETGSPLIVEDANTTGSMDEELRQLCLEMQIISFINIPIIKSNEYRGNLCITQSSPRRWTNFELRLAEEVAERSWAAVERARVEEELRESEERMRLTIRATRMVSWEWIPAENRITTSDSFADLYGLPALASAEEGFALVLEEDRDAHVAKVQNIATEGGVYTSEFRIKRPNDGRSIWLEERAEALLGAQGNVGRVMGVTLDITERKLAEEALRASEEKYRALFNSMDEAYAVVEVMADEQGRWNDFLFLDANPAFMEHTTMPYPVGKTATELLGTPNPRWAQVYGEVAETGESVRIEDAEPTLGRIFDLNIFRLGGPGSRRVAVLFTNITHRKEAEEALQSSEARLHAIANLVPDLLWSNAPTGHTDWYNEQWLNYTGQTLEEATNYGWHDVIHPDDRDNSARNFQEAVDRGEPWRQEHRIRRHDGQYHWFLVQARPLKDQNNQIIRWFGSATDIQDLKEAQQAVLESEERLRIAIDAGELATWNWDVERDEIYWNERHFLLFGMTPREGVTHERDFSSHVHPDDYNFVMARLGAAVDNAGSFEAEFRIIREDNGEVRWMNGYGRTTEARDGRATRMVGVMFDSTERRQAQEILQRAHEDLEKRVEERTRDLKQALQQVRTEIEQRQVLEQARGELMRRIVNTQEEERGRISRELHDNLGQHLTALMLGLQSLEMQISTITGDEKLPQLDNMRTLLDGLMRAAHDQARQLRPAELDAMGLHAALGQYIRDWSARTGVEVDFQAVGWETRPSPEVETTLYRVVQEALTNVARHAEATQVGVIIERRGGTASAIVEDNGRGFDTQQSTRRLGVVGMQERLTIVGGTLEIESAPGEGTTIFARIPLEPNATKSS